MPAAGAQGFQEIGVRSAEVRLNREDAEPSGHAVKCSARAQRFKAKTCCDKRRAAGVLLVGRKEKQSLAPFSTSMLSRR